MARLFVGSSVEGLEAARAIRSNLAYDAEVLIWNEGVFRPSRHALETLPDMLGDCDFAVFVCSPDDVTTLRGEQASTVRDNVILEMGIAIGTLGRLRTFIVQPRDADLRLPTDLAGITPLTYDANRGGSILAALGAACDAIRREIRDASLLFPQHGSFGPNILHADVGQLISDAEYSMAAQVPRGREIRVVLRADDPARLAWAMRLGPEHGLDSRRPDGGVQEFVSIGDGLQQTPIIFSGSGSGTVEVFVGVERVVTKPLVWTPTRQPGA